MFGWQPLLFFLVPVLAAGINGAVQNWLKQENPAASFVRAIGGGLAGAIATAVLYATLGGAGK